MCCSTLVFTHKTQLHKHQKGCGGCSAPCRQRAVGVHFTVREEKNEEESAKKVRKRTEKMMEEVKSSICGRMKLIKPRRTDDSPDFQPNDRWRSLWFPVGSATSHQVALTHPPRALEPPPPRAAFTCTLFVANVPTQLWTRLKSSR